MDAGIHPLFGLKAYNGRPMYEKTDRLWLVALGFAKIIDGLVILSTLTFYSSNLTIAVSRRIASLAYEREKRRLSKHNTIDAYLAGRDAYDAGVPDFTNPYFAVTAELEDAWDEGYREGMSLNKSEDILAQFHDESG